MKSECLKYKNLTAEDIAPSFLDGFERRQEVMLCYRRGEKGWEVRPDPFTDDWTEEERASVVKALQETAKSGGFVQAAFFEGRPVGFAAVCKQPLGKKREYLDLSELHVSREWRRRGVGRRLFQAAAAWAKEHGAEKLYISAHSAVETQVFYRSLGCTDAVWEDKRHVEREPFDCQLEYIL